MATKVKERLVLGVDIGGTKILAAAITDKGDFLGQVVRNATEAEKSLDKIERNIISSIEEAMKAGISVDSFCGIGIGVPGPLDVATGVILTPGNLPNLHNYPLKQVIEKTFRLPVLVDNDANCFTLGEVQFGAGAGARIACGITLGTGLGCGIVIDGKIYRGATGTAAEIWLSPYKNGIFEDFLSGRGIKKIYGSSSNKIKPVEIEEKARTGDNEAITAWYTFGEHLGILIAYIVNLIDPEAVIIGGSISHAYDLFEDAMENTLAKNINPKPREQLKVVKSKLGELAGVVGAASLLLTESF